MKFHNYLKSLQLKRCMVYNLHNMNSERPQFNTNRVGVIDIGTLKTKFVIAEFDKDQNRKILVRERKITNLGQGLNKENRLISPDAVLTQHEVLNEMIKKMEELHVDAYNVIGTEALRKADNAETVITMINEAVRQDLQILGQEEEAMLFFNVVSRSMPNENLAVADIGGGSVQLAIGRNGNLQRLELLNTGTLTLQKGMVESDIVSPTEDQASWEYVHDAIAKLNLIPIGEAHLVYGSTNILDFFREAGIGKDIYPDDDYHPRRANIQELVDLYYQIIQHPRNQRSHFFPSDPYFMWGADKGIINIASLCDSLKIDEVIPTNLNVSDGLLFKLAGN